MAAKGKEEGGRHRIEGSEALGGIAFKALGLTHVMLHKAQKTWVTFTACWDNIVEKHVTVCWSCSSNSSFGNIYSNTNAKP